MLKHFLTILILCSIIYGSGCSHVSKSVPADPAIPLAKTELALFSFMAGQLADEQGDYERAISYYRQVLAIDPEAINVRTNLVQDLIRLSQFQEAADEYRSLVSKKPADEKMNYILGQLHEASGNTKLAEKVYRQTVEQEGTLSGPFTRLGILLLRQEKGQEALKYLKKSVLINPDDRDARLALMRVYLMQGHWEKASELLKQGLANEPHNLEWLAYLAQLYKDHDLEDEARDLFLKIARLYPDYPIANEYLAEYYLKRGQWTSAVSFLKKELEQHPDDLKLQRNLGLAYYKLNKLDEARSILYDIAKQNVSDALTHYLLGSIYRQKKLYYLAEHEFKLAIKDNSQFKEAYFGLAAIYIHNKELEEALALYAVASVKFKKSSYLFLKYGALLLQVKDYNYALKMLTQAKNLEPNNPTILFQLGRTYHALNDFDLATFYWKKAIKFDDQFAEAYNHLGYSYAEKGYRLNQAIKWLEKAVSIDPENGYYLDSLGWAYYKKGKYQAAIKTVLDAKKELQRKDLPVDAVILEHIGDIYLKLSETKKARLAFEQALEKSPKNNSLKRKLKSIALPGGR